MSKFKGMSVGGILRLVYGWSKENPAIPAFYNQEEVDNGMAKTPPMGWSTWNTFQYNINQDLIEETADAMKEKGLTEAGYIHLNIDDCWQDKVRNKRGELYGDPVRFADGMKALAEKVNARGLKLGIYSSNGTMTCVDYPASFDTYYRDAYTFAKWGIEYWKLDYCHSVKYVYCAPFVTGIAVGKRGERGKPYGVEEGKCTDCRIYPIKYKKKIYLQTSPFLFYVRGIDGGGGKIEFIHTAEEEGEYILTVHMFEKNNAEKFLGVLINDEKLLTLTVPGNRIFFEDYEMHLTVRLRKGENSIKLFNPVKNDATSDMLQYQKAFREIIQATKDYAADSGKPEKKIVFSICEGNQANPHLWGKSGGNLWRTTCDIKENWKSIIHNYEHNVQLYEYACEGHWNDPDMLEVGVGNLTYKESEAHFAVWCMMAAPLILGNDIRSMSEEIRRLICNKELISVDQDGLCKQCKRIEKGEVDVLVKPLTDGKTALCVFNKSDAEQRYSIREETLAKETYISYSGAEKARNVLLKRDERTKDILTGTLEKHSVKVYIV